MAVADGSRGDIGASQACVLRSHLHAAVEFHGHIESSAYLNRSGELYITRVGSVVSQTGGTESVADSGVDPADFIVLIESAIFPGTIDNDAQGLDALVIEISGHVAVTAVRHAYRHLLDFHRYGLGEVETLGNVEIIVIETGDKVIFGIGFQSRDSRAVIKPVIGRRVEM